MIWWAVGRSCYWQLGGPDVGKQLGGPAAGGHLGGAAICGQLGRPIITFACQQVNHSKLQCTIFVNKWIL